MNKINNLITEIRKYKLNNKIEINDVNINIIDEKIEILNLYYLKKPINIKYYKTKLMLINNKKTKCVKCMDHGIYQNDIYIYCWKHALELI